MQTFLPYPDFERSARCLDWRRLGKQRVEARMILNILLSKTTGTGWRNHPAVLMWRGFEDALGEYYNACIREWLRRGYRNTMPLHEPKSVPAPRPAWLGREELHASHRANLLRKDPAYYGQFGWTEQPAEGYWWPTKEMQTPGPGRTDRKQT